MDITLLIGISGSAVILAAFILNQVGKWTSESYYYDLANFAGSAILTIYAYLINSVPFIIINVVWALFSFKDIVQRR